MMRLPFRFPMRNRFVAIGVLIVAAIAVGDAVIIAMQRASEIIAYETAAANLSRGMSAQTAKLLGTAGKQLESLETDLGVGGLAGTERVAAALRDGGANTLLTERMNRGAEARPTAILDAAGKVVASRIEEMDNGADASAFELFRKLRAADGPDVIVGAPRQDQDGAWSFYMARRLKDATKSFAGIAALKFSVREFEDFYRLAMPPHREVTVLTNDGTILIHYPHKEGVTGGRAELPGAFDPKAQTCAAFDGPDPVDKAAVVAVICQLGGAQLLLETSTPEDAALGPWRQERLWLSFGGLVIALGVTWLLYVFARQVNRLEVSELSLAMKSEQLETAHSQLEIALANIAQGVSFLDAQQRLVVANDRYLELYGLSKEEVFPGMTLSEILRLSDARVGFHDLNREAFLPSVEDHERARSPQNVSIRFKNGRILSVRKQPLPGGGWVATHEDVTERRRADEKISFLAKHDPLTGLVNRSVLVERLQQMQNDPSGKSFAILFLDLDRFKVVNDTLGHDTGDELLRQVAARMKETVRARDTVARFGGDEFVVLQADISGQEDAASLALRLIEATSAPYRIAGHEINVGASAGISIPTDASDSTETLIKRADIALYASKALGRGVFSFYESHMDPQRQIPSQAA